LEAARDATCEGYADRVTTLIRQHEWREARRLIAEGCDAELLPAGRADVLVDLLAGSLKQQIERCTAPVIRGAKDESRAISGLVRAEALLSSTAELGLPPRAVLSMTRRVWRAHAVLGVRRQKAGQLDAAAQALFHALGMSHIGRRRQQHV